MLTGRGGPAHLKGMRTHEISIRLALGAQTHDVLWLIARQGPALTLGRAVIADLSAGRDSVLQAALKELKAPPRK